MRDEQIRPFRCVLSCTLVIASMIGCAGYDRAHATSLIPIGHENGYDLYTFKAIADTAYPLKSERAEKTRIEWLEKWLSDNGYPNPEYAIFERKPIKRYTGMVTGIYDIFYKVKVRRDER